MLKAGIPLLVPVLAGVVGWFVVNWLSGKQKIADDRRKLRLEYMINAYRTIFRLQSEGINSKEDFSDFRAMVNDIYLFGTKDQVWCIDKFAGTARGQPFEIENLNELLVKEIRQEIGLKFYRGKLGKIMSFMDDA